MSSSRRAGSEPIQNNAGIYAPASPRKHLLWLVLAIVCACGMLFFVDQVWAPGRTMHFSDLHGRWYGTRELFLHGRDPYSAEVTRELQLWRYGHVVDSQSETHDEARFAYPLYIVFLLWPLIWFSFPETYQILRMTLPAISLVTVVLWIWGIRWKAGPVLFASAAILGVCNFPVLEDIYLQQPVLLAALFMAASFAAVTADRLYASGALLALATIKPQVSILLAVWLLFWACCEWRRRRGLVLGFCAAISLLLGASELLLPRWPLEFIAGVAAYQHYTGMLSLLTFALGRVASLVINSFLLLAVAWVVWQTRAATAGSPQFTFAFSAVSVVTIVTAPTMYPTGQIVLIPVIMLLIQHSAWLWAAGGWVRLLFVSVLVLIVWPWIASVGFLLLNAAVPLQTLRSLWIVVVAPIVLVPLSLLVLMSALTHKFLHSAAKSAHHPALERL